MTFTITKCEGISDWLTELYTEYLPPSGVFVEIGVGHTVDRNWLQSDTDRHLELGIIPTQRCGSNTLDLLDQGYTGVYIEPIQEFCNELSLIVGDKAATVINMGVSDRDDSLKLYLGETFTPNPMTNNPGGVEYVGREVKLHPLSTILDRLLIESVDLMSIDVEGWEMKVLAGIKDEHLPKVIVIEINKSQGIHEFLIAKGYTLIHRDSRDAGYVKR